MATFTEDPDNYPAGITVLETTDLVLGGLGEPANMQADELADRTAYLKKRLTPLLTGGLFPAGTETQELAPSSTLLTGDSGKLIVVNDDAGGPYTGQGVVFLPLPSAMNSAGLNGAVIGVASGDHSYELVISVNDGSNILRMSKPSGHRVYVGFGVVIFKYSQARNAWALVASDTSDSVLPAGMFATFPTGTTAKPGWLDCDGSAVPQDDYPLLFAEIGTTYGPAVGGDFTLPDSGSTIDSAGTGMVWRIKF